MNETFEPPQQIELDDIVVCGHAAHVVLNKLGAHITYVRTSMYESSWVPMTYTLSWQQMTDDITRVPDGRGFPLDIRYKTLVFGRFLPLARKLGWFVANTLEAGSSEREAESAKAETQEAKVVKNESDDESTEPMQYGPWED